MKSSKKTIEVADLGPGVTFRYQGTTVTVLRGPEPTKDILGRDVLGFWCQRADTSAEGRMIFGPKGFIRQDEES